MPFTSKRQQRAAFGGHLPGFSKEKALEWAHETPNLKDLPDRAPAEKGKPTLRPKHSELLEKMSNGDMLQYFIDHPDKLREKKEREEREKKSNMAQVFDPVDLALMGAMGVPAGATQGALDDAESRLRGAGRGALGGLVGGALGHVAGGLAATGLKQLGAGKIPQQVAHTGLFLVGPTVGAHLMRNKKANFKLDGERKFRGLDIAIENKKGSKRYWHDPHGKEKGSTLMHYDYGYIRLTEGTDGDHVDVYIGPDEDAENVFIVDQMKKPDFKKFDEQKCMLGFKDEAAAKAAYLRQYNDPGFFGSIKSMPFEEFKMKVLDKANHGSKIAHAKVALSEDAKRKLEVGGGAAGVVGGGVAVSKATPMLTGRTTLYHGTTPELAKKVREQGLRPSAEVGGDVAKITDILGNDIKSKAKNLAYLTPHKSEASGYAGQAEALRDLGPGVDYTSPAAAQKRMQGTLKGQMNPFHKGVVRADVPLWREDIANKLRANPEARGDFNTFKQHIIKDIKARGGMVPHEVLPEGHWARPHLERAFDSQLKGIHDSFNRAVSVEGGVGPEFIRGGSKFKSLGLQELKDYARARPGTMATGAGLTALGIGAGVLGAHSLYKGLHHAPTTGEKIAVSAGWIREKAVSGLAKRNIALGGKDQSQIARKAVDYARAAGGEGAGAARQELRGVLNKFKAMAPNTAKPSGGRARSGAWNPDDFFRDWEAGRQKREATWKAQQAAWAADREQIRGAQRQADKHVILTGLGAGVGTIGGAIATHPARVRDEESRGLNKDIRMARKGMEVEPRPEASPLLRRLDAVGRPLGGALLLGAGGAAMGAVLDHDSTYRHFSPFHTKVLGTAGAVTGALLGHHARKSVEAGLQKQRKRLEGIQQQNKVANDDRTNRIADRLDDLGIGVLAAPAASHLAEIGTRKLMLRGGRLGGIAAMAHGPAEAASKFFTQHVPEHATELAGLALVAPGVTHGIAKGINKLLPGQKIAPAAVPGPQEPITAGQVDQGVLKRAEDVGRLLARDKTAIDVGGIAGTVGRAAWKNRGLIAGAGALAGVGAGLYGAKKTIDTAAQMATDTREPTRYVGVAPGMRPAAPAPLI